MNDKKFSKLDDLLENKIETVSDEALKSDGKISSEKVENLRRLLEIMEVAGVAQKVQTRRLILASILLGTLVTVSILLFGRVSETEIELDISVSQLAFESAEHQPLTQLMDVTVLGASGLQEIRLPHSETELSTNVSNDEHGDAAVKISVVRANGQKGVATLEPIIMSPETRMQLQKSSSHYRFSMEHLEYPLRLAINGPIIISLPQTPAEQLNLKSPKSVVLSPNIENTDLQLTVANSSDIALSPLLSVSEIDLTHITVLEKSGGTIVRQLSTILSGTLYFESLINIKRELRPGELLRFNIIYGEIRTLAIREDAMVMKFHGVVSKMRLGSFDRGTNLMPSYLEWLKAQHGLSLLWGTALYLSGLLIGALKLLRIRI